MKKLKLMTIVGTRPEIIRLSEVIKRADHFFDQVLVHTGQNHDHELSQIFFDELGLRSPDIFLESVGKNLGETVGNIISKSFQIMNENRPDALLVLGDTNSCLSAYAAKRLKVPIFHMEAGNRCFDQNVPEEINRKIVDHISDVNLPYTEHSRRYLLSEGIKKEYVFVTGSPMAEVLQVHLASINKSNILHELGLEQGKYIIVSAHREENIDNESRFTLLMNSINAIASHYNLKVIYSLHPRSKKFIDKRNFAFHKNVTLMRPLGFIDYNALQKNSFSVISDSGTLSEESAILNFSGVLIRDSTERPESIDKGSVIIGGISENEIINSIDMGRAFFDNKQSLVLADNYKDINVSDKVVRIIQGYTKIINKFVWMKGFSSTIEELVELT